MDFRLLAWARRVKARDRAPTLPALWLFTDAARLPEPLPVIARLPRGGAGVVLRLEGYADAATLARAVARLCRARRLSLSVAGDPALAGRLRAGLHLRGGRRMTAARRRAGVITASAHQPADIARGRRAGAHLIFLSPLFATASHPGHRALGVARWSAWARLAGPAAAALGGIDGRRVAALPSRCRAIGAIGALAR